MKKLFFLKKYEKPAIEELHIGALQFFSTSDGSGSGSGGGGGDLAPGRKNKDYDEDDNGLSEGW